MATTAPLTPRGVRRLVGMKRFVQTENASAVVLLLATVAALVWANSPWSASYRRLWDTELAFRLGTDELALDLRHRVNDGLMALFFLVAGLEIRREIDMGELRERRRVALPVLVAVGGMVLPALIYLAFNLGGSAARGWGIAMGTDTAFAVGVLTLVGGASPRERAFLLSMVVVDDAIALTVIAVAYTEDLSVDPLLIGSGLLLAVLALRAAGIRHGVPYFSSAPASGWPPWPRACTPRSPGWYLASSPLLTHRPATTFPGPGPHGGSSGSNRHRSWPAAPVAPSP